MWTKRDLCAARVTHRNKNHIKNMSQTTLLVGAVLFGVVGYWAMKVFSKAKKFLDPTKKQKVQLLEKEHLSHDTMDLLKIGTRMAQISCCIILHQNRSKCLLNITSDLIFCVTKMLSRSRKEANGEENDGVGHTCGTVLIRYESHTVCCNLL